MAEFSFLAKCQKTGKQKFDTEDQAKHQIKKLKKKRDKSRMSAYLCGSCGKWHFGHDKYHRRKLGIRRKVVR